MYILLTIVIRDVLKSSLGWTQNNRPWNQLLPPRLPSLHPSVFGQKASRKASGCSRWTWSLRQSCNLHLKLRNFQGWNPWQKVPFFGAFFSSKWRKTTTRMLLKLGVWYGWKTSFLKKLSTNNCNFPPRCLPWFHNAIFLLTRPSNSYETTGEATCIPRHPRHFNPYLSDSWYIQQRLPLIDFPAPKIQSNMQQKWKFQIPEK